MNLKVYLLTYSYWSHLWVSIITHSYICEVRACLLFKSSDSIPWYVTMLHSCRILQVKSHSNHWEYTFVLVTHSVIVILTYLWGARILTLAHFFHYFEGIRLISKRNILTHPMIRNWRSSDWPTWSINSNHIYI